MPTIIDFINYQIRYDVTKVCEILSTTSDLGRTSFKEPFHPVLDEDVEYYLVSYMFAEKLKEQGEKVIENLYGMYIWCRKTEYEIHEDPAMTYLYNEYILDATPTTAKH